MNNLMKKLCLMSLALLPLTACGADGDALPEKPQSQPATRKTLVVYFSCTNTTKGVAEKIAAALEADTWRITPTQPYMAADLNYNDAACRANREQNDAAARPAISGSVDLAEYDLLFVGYPIWWGKLPKILWTFFEAYDLRGKTIVPFCTSGGSGIATSVKEIRALEPQATVKEGRRLGGDSAQSIAAWAKNAAK